MKAQNSYDLEHCYELLELANGAKPSDVERNWRALSEVYDSNRFTPGSTSHTICAKKMQMVSYAYKKIKTAMRHYDENAQNTSGENLLELRRQAESGDNGAAYRLAIMFEEGIVCREDLQNAAYWYALAAKRGHLESQFKLGEALLNGKGVERDFSRALQFLKITAANNHTASFFLLSLITENGLGVAQNIEEALRWYRKSAEKGDKEASNKVQDLSIRI